MGEISRKNFIPALLTVLAGALLCACSAPAAVSTDVPAPPSAIYEASAPLPTTSLPPETPAPTAPPTELPRTTGPDLPAREPTDDSFFKDAAFFGNSLVNGLELFGGLEYGDFYAVTSASVVNVGMTKNTAMSDGTAATMLQALCEKQYAKIYVLLGINEIGFETDYFVELYSAMLDTIAAKEPDADIYIMSLTPVTEKRSAQSELFSTIRVQEYNDALYRLAEERGCFYVDLMEALQDENGYLPEEQSTDGIHLTADKYPAWADYLRAHYMPVA